MKLAAPFPLRENRRALIDEYNISFHMEKHKVENLIE